MVTSSYNILDIRLIWLRCYQVLRGRWCSLVLDFVLFLLLLFLPIERILDSSDEHLVVFADVFLITDGHLVTLVIQDGLQDSTRIQILLLAYSHCWEQDLQLLYQLHTWVNQFYLQCSVFFLRSLRWLILLGCLATALALFDVIRHFLHLKP